MFDVVTFGAATQDNFIKIPQDQSRFLNDEKSNRELIAFEHNAKIPVEEAASFPGGGAVNVALAMKQLGFSPMPVIAVGWDNFGQIILDKLSEKRISQDYALHLQGVHTAFSTIISTHKGDRTAFVFRGASDHITKKLLPNFEKLARAKLLMISHMSGESAKLLDDIFKLKKLQPGLKIAWNPGMTQIKEGLLGLKNFLMLTDVLLVNKEEAETLTGINISSHDSKELRQLTSKIREAGAHIVTITDAKNGAVAETPKGFYRVGEFPATVVNTTGAGDSFFAGLSAGLFYTQDIQKALLFGSVNAASTITHTGAQNGYLAREEIESTLDRHPEFTVQLDI